MGHFYIPKGSFHNLSLVHPRLFITVHACCLTGSAPDSNLHDAGGKPTKWLHNIKLHGWPNYQKFTSRNNPQVWL